MWCFFRIDKCWCAGQLFLSNFIYFLSMFSFLLFLPLIFPFFTSLYIFVHSICMFASVKNMKAEPLKAFFVFAFLDL